MKQISNLISTVVKCVDASSPVVVVVDLIRHHRCVSGEDLVSKPTGQGEAAARGGNREIKAISETPLAPQFRLGTHVLRGGSAWYTGCTTLHRGCHGQAHSRRCGGSHVHGTAWSSTLIMTQVILDIVVWPSNNQFVDWESDDESEAREPEEAKRTQRLKIWWYENARSEKLED